MRRRSWRGAISASCTLLAALTVLGDCSDSSMLPTHPSGGDAQKLRDGVVVSGPLGSAPAVSTSGPGVPSTTVLTYVSMPPGTLTDGDSIRIANRSVAVGAPMGGGGFDPVAIEAAEGDSLGLGVFRHGEAGARVYLRVPHLRQPAVIRTSPGRGRTDVPLNQGIVIILSQPLDASTVTSSSILLELNGVPVPVSVQLQVGQPWVVVVSPTSLLAPNATYTIVVTTAVQDANGSQLPAQVTSDFTTGTSSAAVAAISVRASNTHAYQGGAAALAAVGGTVTFVASNVSAAGDTLQPDSGQDMEWSSSDPLVATVVANGFSYRNIGDVTAIGLGSASILACLGGICGEGSITVRATSADVAPVLMADLGGNGSKVFAGIGQWAVGTAFSSAGGCQHAFLWSASTGAQDLGTLPGECYSIAYLVNGGPVIIGAGDAQSDRTESQWIWTRAAGMQRLSMPVVGPGRWNPSHLDSIGNILFLSDSNRAAIRDPGGSDHLLAPPVGWRATAAMNDQHQMAFAVPTPEPCDKNGYCDSTCGTVGYVWDFSTQSTVATLEPRDPKTNDPLAICLRNINNTGMVGGSVFVLPQFGGDTIAENAFRWSTQRGFEFAPLFDPGTSVEGIFMNDAGDEALNMISYVHIGSDSVFELRAAVWMADGRIIRLGSLGGEFTAADGFNDNGIVVGHSQVGSSTGQDHAVFWDLKTAGQPSASRANTEVHAAHNRRTDPRAVSPQQTWKRNSVWHSPLVSTAPHAAP